MFKFMAKTAVLASLAGGAAIAAFGADDIKDWFHTSKKKVEHHISEFQGMTAELRKIEGRVGKLDREILELKENALREELEIKNLREEIEQRDGTVEHLHRNLKKAEKLLNSNHDKFNIQGITYTRREIEQDVTEKMGMFKVQQETLAQLRQTMLTRQNAMAIAEENVTRGKSVREELAGKVNLLKAQLERYKARQVYAEAVAMDFDAQEFNTGIGEARKSLAHFERKLAVKNRLLDDRLRISGDAGHVAGIDYEAPATAEMSLTQALSELLDGKSDFTTSESSVAVVKNRKN